MVGGGTVTSHSEKVVGLVACVSVMVVSLSSRWLLKTAGMACSTHTGMSCKSGGINWMAGWMDIEESCNQHWIQGNKKNVFVYNINTVSDCSK